MKPNAMRAGVARGELQIGTWVTMARNPAILALLQAAGLDFARIDMNTRPHPWKPSPISRCCRARWISPSP